MRCDEHIVKYLGITLLPQAGVALGMAIKAQTLGPQGLMIANITLFAVLIYELVGPLLTKISLEKAGEIMGIDLLDHLVIGNNRYISMRSEGLF